MARRRKTKTENPIHRASSAKRWIVGGGLALGLLAMAFLAEYLTRPADAPQITGARSSLQSNTQPRQLTPPAPAAPDLDATVAEGRQLGSELAEQFPENPEALNVAGSIQFTFGNPEGAIANWTRAVQMDPRLGQAWLGLAKTAHKQGDFTQAIESMRQLEQVAPQLAATQVFFLVDSLLKSGQPEKVVDLLESLGADAELPGGARVTLGQAYYQLKKYPSAVEQYEMALQDPSQAPVAHYGLSMALIRLGRKDEAAEHRQEYARLQKENMTDFDRMQNAGTDRERNDPKPLHPLLAGFHFEAAKLYAQRGERDSAELHAYRAWALSPDRPEPRMLLESFRQP